MLAKNGLDNGVHFKLHSVKYGGKSTKVNFFDMLGRINRIQLEEMLSLNEVYKSSCAKNLRENEDIWRKAYWENHHTTVCHKSNDWKFEPELRLYLTGLSESRIGRYDFNLLKGIIFGVRTSEFDKIEVINIVKRLCIKYNRKTFKFYQARFTSDSDMIEMDYLAYLSEHFIELD